MPGAGGLIAMQHVARSPVDGYTFALATFTQLAVNPWLFDRPAYDPVEDFAPVTRLFESQLLLVTRPDAPLASFRDVVDAARARPGRVSYGTSGIGQPPHVLMELMRHRLGLDLLHVPYKGGPAAVTGLLAGDVDLMFEGAAGSSSSPISGHRGRTPGGSRSPARRRHSARRSARTRRSGASWCGWPG